jgi:hypothetical protein
MARPSNQHPRERRREFMQEVYYNVLPWVVFCICIIAMMFVLRMIGTQKSTSEPPKDSKEIVGEAGR